MLLSALLLGLYFLVEFAWRLVHVLRIRTGIRDFLRRWLWRIRIVYEPIALASIFVAFILINPLVHGIAVAVVVAGAFPHFRNYLSGRLFRLENSLRIEEEIEIGGVRGEVIRLGRLGIKVRGPEGLHHLGYHHLVQHGYVLAAGSETGEFFNLYLRPTQESKPQQTAEHLTDLFATTPYVDWSVRPEIVRLDDENPEWTAKVQLRDVLHLPELVAFLKESGYECKSLVKPRS